MMNFAHMSIVLVSLASGTYLVATEHYGWAWIPFLVAADLIERAAKK